MEATDILQKNNNFIIHDDINARHQLTSLGIKSLLSIAQLCSVKKVLHSKCNLTIIIKMLASRFTFFFIIIILF